jgi:hypothetical protein
MYGYCKNCGAQIKQLNEDLSLDSAVCDSRCHVEFVDRNFDGKWSLKVDMNNKKIKFMNNLYDLCLAFLKSGKDVHLLIRSLNVHGFISKEDFICKLENEFGVKKDKKCTLFTEELHFQKTNPNVNIPEDHKFHLNADAESLDEVITIIYDSKESFADLLPERSFVKESRVFPKYLI